MLLTIVAHPSHTSLLAETTEKPAIYQSKLSLQQSRETSPWIPQIPQEFVIKSPKNEYSEHKISTNTKTCLFVNKKWIFSYFGRNEYIIFEKLRSISTEKLRFFIFSRYFSSRSRLVGCRQGLTEPSRARLGQGGTERMLGPEERAAQTGSEPHVLGRRERLRHCSRCQHADIYIHKHSCWDTDTHRCTHTHCRAKPINTPQLYRSHSGQWRERRAYVDDGTCKWDEAWKSNFWNPSGWIYNSKSFNIW